MMETLFRLPTPKCYQATPYQLRMLDLIALREGVELPPIPSQSRRVLRHLLTAKLVACLGLGPARYKLTQIGRLVRSNGNASRIKRVGEHSRAGASRPEEAVA